MSTRIESAAPLLVGVETLMQHLDRDLVRSRVHEALAGAEPTLAVTGTPGELLFDSPRGDCHVKYGYLKSDAHFVVKVATGFYGNETLGLPVNGGVVLLFSRYSGHLQAILQDAGWLTAWRTAAAGSLASRALARPDPKLIAVIGTGQQAELQAIWHRDVFPAIPIVVAGRHRGRARQLADKLFDSGLSVEISSITEAVEAADVIVTATSATAPLFAASLVKGGAHVTAVGSDAAGKQELDPSLLARADLIATDDHMQCLEGGEFGNAVRAGVVRESGDVSLAAVLSGETGTQRAEGVTIADLTGLTLEDLAIASFFRAQLDLVE